MSETEIESILKKSVKTKLKLLGTMVSHSGGSGSLELGFLISDSKVFREDP